MKNSCMHIAIYNYGPLCRQASKFFNLRGGCFPEGLIEGKQPWMFPYTEDRNCFIIFLPMFYWLSSLWGKLGCSAGSNGVVSRQRKSLLMFHRLSPLWGKIGLFGGEQ